LYFFFQPKYRQANTNGETNGHQNGVTSKEEKEEGIPLGLQDRYDIGDVIGEGNFAVVRECADK
jgi:hypothetical protein